MRRAHEEIQAELEYGKLCTAYVAMTRSKQALYVLTKKLKSDTTSRNFPRLLMLTLNPGKAAWWSSGTRGGSRSMISEPRKRYLPGAALRDRRSWHGRSTPRPLPFLLAEKSVSARTITRGCRSCGLFP